jgi:proteic killer suppression protein
MEISFVNRKLKKECESQSVLHKAHGQACARKIMARIADLLAASSLADLRDLPGGCHELDGDRSGQLSTALSAGKVLVFEPDLQPIPRRRDGDLDWAAIRTVRLLAIETEKRDARGSW